MYPIMYKFISNIKKYLNIMYKFVSNVKNIPKNKYFILSLLFIILIIIIYFSHSLVSKKNKINESFIGKEKSTVLSDLGDDIKVEKKDYVQFPPLTLKYGKSKYDLLDNIFGKDENTNVQKVEGDNQNNNKPNDIPISMPQIQDVGKNELEKSELQKRFSKLNENKPLLGSCDFYFNKCPNNKSSMATIKGNNLTCSKNEEESKKAEAIAQIKNGYISKITIIHNGVGYNYQNPPKVNIISNSGNGASAKAIVDKNGNISSIDIIDYGYGYVETPSIEIEPPQMDGVCHLCC